jgi:hypothetical protein
MAQNIAPHIVSKLRNYSGRSKEKKHPDSIKFFFLLSFFEKAKNESNPMATIFIKNGKSGG